MCGCDSDVVGIDCDVDVGVCWLWDVCCVYVKEGRREYSSLWDACVNDFGCGCDIVVGGAGLPSAYVICDEFDYRVWNVCVE